MKKWILLALCLITAMTLTACHVDRDPWPDTGTTNQTVSTAPQSTAAQDADTFQPAPTAVPQNNAPDDGGNLNG